MAWNRSKIAICVLAICVLAICTLSSSAIAAGLRTPPGPEYPLPPKPADNVFVLNSRSSVSGKSYSFHSNSPFLESLPSNLLLPSDTRVDSTIIGYLKKFRGIQSVGGVIRLQNEDRKIKNTAYRFIVYVGTDSTGAKVISSEEAILVFSNGSYLIPTR